MSWHTSGTKTGPKSHSSSHHEEEGSMKNYYIIPQRCTCMQAHHMSETYGYSLSATVSFFPIVSSLSDWLRWIWVFRGGGCRICQTAAGIVQIWNHEAFWCLWGLLFSCLWHFCFSHHHHAGLLFCAVLYIEPLAAFSLLWWEGIMCLLGGMFSWLGRYWATRFQTDLLRDCMMRSQVCFTLSVTCVEC